VLNYTGRERIIYPWVQPIATTCFRTLAALRGVIAVLVSCSLIASASGDDAALSRRKAILGTFGTYAGEPRLPNGHIDAEKLLADLTELKANTYHFLIW
jgi:hypothetical protein